MYECHLCEPESVTDFIDLINEENYEIISCVYFSDSRQVMLIVEKQKPKPKLTIFGNNEEEEE